MVVAVIVMTSYSLAALAETKVSVPFWAKVYGYNPSYLVVTVDTSGLPANTHLEKVLRKTSLFDATGAKLGDVTFQFWGQHSPLVYPAKLPLARYIGHRFSNARTARNGVLRFEVWTNGQKQDGTPEEEPHRLDTGESGASSSIAPQSPEVLSPVPFAEANLNAGEVPQATAAVGKWTYRMQSNSGPGYTGQLTLQQAGSGAFTGSMVTTDGTHGLLTGKLRGRVLQLTRDTGLQTLQLFSLFWVDGRWTGTYENEGQYADSGTVDLSR